MAVGADRPALIVLAGPTAAGKTSLALQLAEQLPVEIVSADSRQVYRGMDIGTAKPTRDELARVPHHLIDLVDPDQEFNAADFTRLGRQAIADIHSRGRLPLVVGGTGLYIRSLVGGFASVPAGNDRLRRDLLQLEAEQGEGALYRRLQQLDPPLAARLPAGDRMRILRALEVQALTGRRLSDLQAEHRFADRPFQTLEIGLTPPREELYRRIDLRVEEMLAAGLVEETASLLERGYSPTLKALRTIGYRELIRHLQGDLPLTEAVRLIQRETRRYAKRQLTWFRQIQEIIWVDSSRESDRILALIDNFMRNKRSGHG